MISFLDNTKKSTLGEKKKKISPQQPTKKSKLKSLNGQYSCTQIR